MEASYEWCPLGDVFNIFTNYIDDGIECTFRKIADNRMHNAAVDITE